MLHTRRVRAQTEWRRFSQLALLRVGAALAAGATLAAGAVSASWAASDTHGPSSAIVGGFGIGDGLEGVIEEQDGALRVSLPVPGVTVSWDSRSIASDRAGLGPGWVLGAASIDRLGGVRVLTPTGRWHRSDDTAPSGLAGYGAADVRFEARHDVLPAREDGEVEEVAYAFTLYEVGGIVTHFNEMGDPVARLSGVGAQRQDWEWDELVPHRLRRVVDARGVSTVLDWETEPGTVLIRPAAELPGSPLGEWRVELDGGRIEGVIDPAGGRTRFGYDGGVLDHVSTTSGATTLIGWRALDDRVARVDRLVTTDQRGAVLSQRSWRALDARTGSGWPGPGRYATELSDGHSRVVSRYNELHVLHERELIVDTPSGELRLQTHAFTYPGMEGGVLPDPEALPANWGRASTVELTRYDALGRSRSEIESFSYDPLGRLERHVAADGTETAIEYAPPPGGDGMPGSIPVRRLSTFPDGLVTEELSELNPEGTAATAVEHRTGAAGAPLVVTERVERTIDADGFVTEERLFHGAADEREPVVSRWTRTRDAGEETVHAQLAVGSPAESTAAQTTSLAHLGVTSETDAVGRTTRSEYDRLGRPMAATDPAGLITTIDYRTAGTDGINATTTTRPDGVAVTEVVDALGRLIELRDNIDRGRTRVDHVRIAETRAYPEPGTIEVTDAWGATTTTRQDVFGRAIETIGSNGLTQLVLHDDVARTTTTALTTTGQLADAELTAVERHDANGNPIAASATRRDGLPAPETRITYDGRGRPVTIDDGLVQAAITRDAGGNPTTTTLSPVHAAEHTDSVTATRRFDDAGRSLEKTLSTRDERRSGGARTVDQVGRTTTTTDQLGRTTSVEYTPDGLPARTVAEQGRITEYRYDPLTRLVTEVSVITDGHDAVRTTHAYDDLGRLIGLFDPADREHTEIAYEWNAFGELADVTYPDGERIVHEYDRHGRRIATTDVAGNRTEFSYDVDGFISRAVQRDGDGKELSRVDYTFDAFGRITELALGNGVTTTYEHTSVDQISVERTSNAAGPTTERRYAYDVEGNLSARTDLVFAPDEDEPAATTTSYGYDAFGRLVRSAIHPGEHADVRATTETQYDLTVSGDIARETVTTADGTVVRAFDYGPSGELHAVTTTDATGTRTAEQAYDRSGNLVLAADGARTVYDAVNRPVSHLAADGTITDTTYWADGSRRELVVIRPGGEVATTRFHWDDGALSTERISTEQIGTDGDAVTVAYLRGMERHARSVIREEGSTTGYFGSDRHGNITELFDHDGRVAARYTYSDSGIRSRTHGSEPAPANPFGYAGEYTHDDGTQYLRTRIYDPETMRFTTQDTVELHNTYAYADLNPITKVDPSGRNGESDRRNLAFAVVGVLCAVSGIFTGGLSLNAFCMFAVGVALVDTGIAIAESMNLTRAIELPEHTATSLAITGLVAGIVAGVLGIVRCLLDTVASMGRRAEGMISRSSSDSWHPMPSHSRASSTEISDFASSSSSSSSTSAQMPAVVPPPAPSVVPPPPPPPAPTGMRRVWHTAVQPPIEPPILQPAVSDALFRSSLSLRWAEVAENARIAYDLTAEGALGYMSYVPHIARAADELFSAASKQIVDADYNFLVRLHKEFVSDKGGAGLVFMTSEHLYQDNLRQLGELAILRYLYDEHKFAIDALNTLF